MPKSSEKFLAQAETLKSIEEDARSVEGEQLPIPLALANNIKPPVMKKTGLNYCTYKSFGRFFSSHKSTELI